MALQVLTRSSRHPLLQLALLHTLATRRLLTTTNTNNTNTIPVSPSSSPTASPKTATEAASHLLAQFPSSSSSQQPLSVTDTLDASQFAKLIVTLARPASSFSASSSSSPAPQHRPAQGTPLPPGYHLIYHLPTNSEASLGPDGTDTTFNAPAPFTRRMWAGGRIRWLDGADNAHNTHNTHSNNNNNKSSRPSTLRIGDTVTEETRLIRAVPKRSGKDAREMVLVEVEKRLFVHEPEEDGLGRGGGRRTRERQALAVIDERSWIFQQPLSPSTTNTIMNNNISNSNNDNIPSDQDLIARTKPSTRKDILSSTTLTISTPTSTSTASTPSIARHLSFSPVALFRFSALTFNGHMIHYNDPWARTVEGHRGLVVHGPLNLICMLDYWRDVYGGGGGSSGAGAGAGAVTGENISLPQALPQGAQRPSPNNPPQQITEITYRALSPIYAGDEYVIRTQGITTTRRQSPAPSSFSSSSSSSPPPTSTTTSKSSDKNLDQNKTKDDKTTTTSKTRKDNQTPHRKEEGGPEEQLLTIYDLVVVQGDRVCMKGTITARSV
ncbi:hypothetical protein BD289DRAFT_442882 [Coniella lustricola]|uniref:N-terminal of MaoC-like dehydratase domain-containing protein n=1 Tax=Coniella lustricola TaxID=2025994 RepID=A0A2T2ZXQ2_9PEZI|nr:hypothetical protein BD289DRAFT_442882 [Coniella lustricola]